MEGSCVVCDDLDEKNEDDKKQEQQEHDSFTEPNESIIKKS